MIQKALVAVEDDWPRMDPTVESAIDVLAPTDAELILCHVFPQDEFEGYLREMGYDSADPDEVASRHEVVQRAAERFRDSGLEPTVVGRCGDPTEQLTAHIEEHDIDHVFMGGRNRSAVGKALLGSVSQGVLRGVGVPCTIVMS